MVECYRRIWKGYRSNACGGCEWRGDGSIEVRMRHCGVEYHSYALVAETIMRKANGTYYRQAGCCERHGR